MEPSSRVVALALALAGCTGGERGEPPMDAGHSVDSRIDAGIAVDAGAPDVDGASDASSSDGGIDGAVDAAMPCPSTVPGFDSDGDGEPDSTDCLPCDPAVHPAVTDWHASPRPDGSCFYRVPDCGGRGELIADCISHRYSCGTQYERTNTSQQRCR